MAGSCEQGTEPSCFITGGEFAYFRSQQFFKKDYISKQLIIIDPQYEVTYNKITFLQRVTGYVIAIREFWGI